MALSGNLFWSKMSIFVTSQIIKLCKLILSSYDTSDPTEKRLSKC